MRPAKYLCGEARGSCSVAHLPPNGRGEGPQSAPGFGLRSLGGEVSERSSILPSIEMTPGAVTTGAGDTCHPSGHFMAKVSQHQVVKVRMGNFIALRSLPLLAGAALQDVWTNTWAE